jgi:AcrR family transcriptional regulator
MSRTVGSFGPKTLEAIRQAGLRLIFEHGYEAMSLRQLAAEVGIRPSSLYNYMHTKQDLLFSLIEMHMQELLDQVDAALTGVVEPADRLAAFVAFHVRYHMVRKSEVSVVNFELRSLDAEHYATVVEMRKRYESRLGDIIEGGIKQGAFGPLDVAVATFAILAMLTGVCTWYRPDGRLSEAEIIEAHTGMALRSLGARI